MREELIKWTKEEDKKNSKRYFVMNRPDECGQDQARDAILGRKEEKKKCPVHKADLHVLLLS